MQPPIPGRREAIQLAARLFDRDARVVVLRDADLARELGATLLDAPAPADAIVALHLTRGGPLMPQLEAIHDALPAAGRALVSDVVWQTAPTPELLKAFAPAPSREKVRPVEGYEMHVEHAGFAIEERVVFARDAWLGLLTPHDERRAAIEADARGAARAILWSLRKA